MADQDLTKGPVWRALAAVSAPMAFGILSVLSVGLVDAWFLARLGQAPLAAIGFIYPTTTAIVSLSIGLSAGANAAVSQAIGRGTDGGDVTRMSLHALGLGVALSLLGAGLFIAAYDRLFALMGAGPEVLDEIRAYVPWWTLSFPVLVAGMVTNAILRAHGNAAMAAIFMIGGALVNVAMNPVLIFGAGPVPALGTEGAGMATFIGRAAATVVGLAYAIRGGYLNRCGTLMRQLQPNLAAIVGVGAPAAFSNAINPAGMALVTAAVATLGDAAVAGFGAATRVQAVAIVTLMALSAGMSPMVGQNWGAGRVDRARAALLQAWAFCLLYGLGIAALLTLDGEAIARAFTSDADAAGFARDYLQVVSWSFAGYGVLVTANAAFNARSKPLFAMGLGIGRTVAVYFPLAWLGVTMLGYPGILAAAIAANLAGAAGALALARRAGLLPGWPETRGVLGA